MIATNNVNSYICNNNSQIKLFCFNFAIIYTYNFKLLDVKKNEKLLEGFINKLIKLNN
jgi:hypothetical protein